MYYAHFDVVVIFECIVLFLFQSVVRDLHSSHIGYTKKLKMKL